jgi:hypothetical protein
LIFKEINFFEVLLKHYERKKPGDDLLSRARADAVPSALGGSLVLFGMGRQVSPPVWSPSSNQVRFKKIKRKIFRKISEKFEKREI